MATARGVDACNARVNVCGVWMFCRVKTRTRQDIPQLPVIASWGRRG